MRCKHRGTATQRRICPPLSNSLSLCPSVLKKSSYSELESSMDFSLLGAQDLSRGIKEDKTETQRNREMRCKHRGTATQRRICPRLSNSLSLCPSVLKEYHHVQRSEAAVAKPGLMLHHITLFPLCVLCFSLLPLLFSVLKLMYTFTPTAFTRFLLCLALC